LATDVCGQVLGFSRPFQVAVFVVGFKYKSTAASSAFSKTRKTLNGALTLSVLRAFDSIINSLRKSN
jgi:hypothetical protein